MLRMVTGLRGFALRATDGEIGKVCDLYFDDREWKIRYMVVDTGGWLTGRQVLISPFSIAEPKWREAVISVRLTKHQVEQSPPVDAHRPLTRRHEKELAAHYRWPSWWGGTGAALVAVWATLADGNVEEQNQEDSRLSSMKAVIKYRIADANGPMAYVDDFMLDCDQWIIRYVVVKTGRFLSGRKALIATDWIQALDWRKSLVHVDITRLEMDRSPLFDDSLPMDRHMEKKLYDF